MEFSHFLKQLAQDSVGVLLNNNKFRADGFSKQILEREAGLAIFKYISQKTSKR